jgi:hypothetical protein
MSPIKGMSRSSLDLFACLLCASRPQIAFSVSLEKLPAANRDTLSILRTIMHRSHTYSTTS